MAGIDRSQVLDLFQQEAEELLQELSDGLLQLEEAGGGADLVRPLFRAAHTLKGSAAMMELGEVSRIAHHMEDLLGEIAEGKVVADGAAVTLLLEGVDQIQDCLLPETDAASVLSLYEARLHAFDQRATGADAGRPSVEKTQAAAPRAQGRAPVGGSEKLQTIRVDTAKLNGLINGVGELIISKNILQENMRTLEVIHREFEQLTFLFGNEAVRLERDLSHLAARKDAAQKDREGSPLDLIQQRISDEILPVRGELERLTGALTTAIQSVTQQSNSLAQHTVALKNLVTQVRMVPITTVFERVPRIVRDAASVEGKEVRLVRHGEQTEIDRGVADKVVDPLLHIIRNAISHGVEKPDQREAAGKEAAGVISLAARTECGRVVIEVADDGGGINIERIREKSLSSGAVTAEEAVTFNEHQWLQMIFRPSFSTATEVTAVSGRGVGMDVVKTAIEELKGHVDVRTEMGKGTTITLSLPSSLDIAQAMRIRAGGQEFVFLMDTIDMARGGRGAEVVLSREGRFLTLADRTVPLRRLDGLLHLPQEWSCGWVDRPILVLRVLDRCAAILVDEIIDHEEVFVKPPHLLLKELALYSGATILGDGRVRPILSAGHLLDQVAGNGPAEAASLTPLNATEHLAELFSGRTLLVADCDAQLPAGWRDGLAEHGVVTEEVTTSTEAFSALIRSPAPAAVVCSPMLATDLVEAFPNTPLCMVAEQAGDVAFLPPGVTHWVSDGGDGRCLTECLLDLFTVH
ncbi:MAG: chemotaxis protein CheA [Nitrospirota bacterium]|jgi:chemotaxis protein histidine kinase CheA